MRYLEKFVPVCSRCGSHDVIADAAATFNIETQEWEMADTHCSTDCQNCEGECSTKELRPNPTLYNNCTHNLQPDMAQFDCFEIQPCAYDPISDSCEPCEEHEATMWTVYGHYPSGGVQAITDVSTYRLAVVIACNFDDLLVRLRKNRPEAAA